MDGEVAQAEKNFLTRDRTTRKRVLDIYNKEEEDFDSKDEWNAYLEEREDIIFNLVENIDVQQTNKRLEEYKQREVVSIETVRARKARREQDAAAVALAGADLANAQLKQDGHAASPTPATQGTTGYGTYVPAGMSLAMGMAPTAPVPMAKVEMNGEGTIQFKRVNNNDQFKKMAAASGWSQELVVQRAMHDAFTSLFIA